MDMTPQTWPEWYDGRYINEVLFCQQFLDKHPMKCVRGRLFTVDGLIEDEGQIGNLILAEISGVLTSGLSKVVTNLLASIKLQAYSPPLPIETDRSHVATGTYFMDGSFTADKSYCNNRLSNEDKLEGESNSIQNQRELLTKYAQDGYFDDYTLLTDEQKKQVEFVQFHPSYDYSDFVEGLRPKVNDDGTMGFELQDGIFKKFVARARKNYEDSQKSKEAIEKAVSVQESMMDFFAGIELGVDTFKTINGNEFCITSVDDKHINISIPGNATVNKLSLNVDEIRRMLEADVKFTKIKDITAFFGKSFATQAYSYDFAIYKAIKAKKSVVSKARGKQEELKKYIFIIDEINRGEISKIFGELFFAIDPGYRGRAGEISTQYANLHADPDEKFYIPENVYIIGTMNDIDRSVDSFDFAMRRRFRFVELKADERLEMLASLEDEELEAEAIRRMAALNREIASVADLNENYQIGASYFLKLKTLNFDQLWTDYLQPLLHEYVQGKYRNQLRRMNDPEREKELKEQAKAISAELKPLREDLRMAKRIEEKYPQLQQLLETERDMETRVRTRERERGYER